QEYWYFYNGIYPTTTGLSVQSISEIIINSDEEPTGSIIIESNPQGASIYLDDEDIGRYTPSILTGIETGMYTIRVELDDYTIPDDEWVTVKTDTPAMVHFNLTQEGGSIEISSVPTGAQIFCDGKDTGFLTDTILELISQGERTITLVKEGYENETITVEVEIDETTFIDIILLPITDKLNRTAQEGNGTDDEERSLYIIQNMTPDNRSGTLQPTASPNITHVTVSTPSVEDEGIFSRIISFFSNLWKMFLSVFGDIPEEELPPKKVVEEDLIVIDSERTEKEEREPVERVARNRTGGLSVESYPQGREITLDNKKTDYITPIVLNGLREGLHSIRLEDEVNRRVWVHPDAIVPVRIDLTVNKRLRTITITSTEYFGKRFTVNGAYPAYTIPATVELEGDRGWITIHSEEWYHSFSVPDSILNGGTFEVLPEERDRVSLLVESDPSGAAIFVDGFPITDHTPAMIDNLTPGKYQIVLSKPGFLPANGEVTIRQGTMESAGRVQSSLTPYPSGSLEVNSTPTGQRIYLYGRYTGETTPHIFDHMRIGTYEVTIQGTDGSISRTMTVLPDTSVECMI
ncbi:PEGA domain-containing protein, partial [Methanocalculus sp.]|uniref:PEGA domain-containing protein n=1 Tax=Methanocalculus sp. TaxID=2004547 RepID=UPI002716C2EA